MSAAYFRYWGKAQAEDGQGERFHLLPFHCLDVAACGQRLLRLPQFSLQPLADELGWRLEQVEAVFVCFLALHDAGKFARAFQGLAPDLSPELVPPNEDKRYTQRHDTLGWWLWRKLEDDERLPEVFLGASPDFWAGWVRAVTGHHGKPPFESARGGQIPADAGDFFLKDDCEAACTFIADAAELILAGQLPLPSVSKVHRKALARHSWRLAGLAVLADWLGSNQSFFPYHSQPVALSEYWSLALKRADEALASAGLAGHCVRSWEQPLALFDYLKMPTPLQQYAATVPLEDGPQLFLLEDVTGAGKTEAALILTQRLMQAGRAKGLYFALPSMATANQMYQRVGQVYSRLYAEGSMPSLILAHGARQLVEGFQQSILQRSEQKPDRNYEKQDQTASAQCNAWMADNNKKALLAEVGVGTLDQALLAVLPARHQSLRLLGLGNKVLLVDEVHAYDAYMMRLLRTLLKAHARQGGSVILLSATLPLCEREQLLMAYRSGLQDELTDSLDDTRYPLAVRAGNTLQAHACATRPQVRRHVKVELVHNEAQVIDIVLAHARKNRCVAWIRNTVDDARRAARALQEQLAEDKLSLFHSRYAMGHRLDIEADVLSRFGKHSRGEVRGGRVLVGTQVLEQSLDFDVDVLVSDLAPIDLLIQRAGRLQRHARLQNGDPAPEGVEQRPDPVLYVLTPEADEEPGENWYGALFPKAKYVYPDAGRLWLGARALKEAGCIITPGESGQRGGVRSLVEAVYGTDIDAVPEGLQRSSQAQIGESMAMQSQANFNALNLDKGYCIDSSARWYEDDRVPTRLGDESLTLYLAKWQDGELLPLCEDKDHVWEQSAVRIAANRAKSLSPAWQARFDTAIAALRARYRLLEERAFILPLVEEEGILRAEVLDVRDKVMVMSYSLREGLVW
ncbi:MAG: CRISPR-associated helicase Cas3' [Lautropia sp.]|nr:CRISPR-associated helicase Cas3' [Lautropia sp.]